MAVLRRLGYVGISLVIDATSNRGVTLRNAKPDVLRRLIAANLAGLRAILEHNRARRILLFRISSRVIPFGGHAVNTVPWREEFAGTLAELGGLIRAADMRVSMHPGQYALLTSPDAAVTGAAFRDLAWQARLLDALGLDASHKLVIHGGGAYGDKAAAMRRWAERFTQLPDEVRQRLVVENDERVYSVADVLELSAATGVPVVCDLLHHRLKPSLPERGLHDLLEQCFATWGRNDGPPKIHYSSPARDKRGGAHAEYIDARDFGRFLAEAPGVPFDCMLEAKAKDLALLRLRSELAISA